MSADLEVDEPLARRLIAGQFFTPRTLVRLGEGWDNTVWVADERWVFRFPRRALAIPGVEREIALLEPLSAQLPLAIPVPRFVGAPADGFPWPFFGAKLIRGRELPLAAPTDDERRALARPLAEFLRALHGARLDAELPLDPFGRTDMAVRVPRTIEALRAIEPRYRPPASVSAVLEAARELPRANGAVVVHGDLHFRHLLLDGGRLTGCVDWGDLCRADPAADLALCWCALPPDAREDFLAHYRPATEEQLLRARVVAIFMCAALAARARQGAILRVALGGLARLA